MNKLNEQQKDTLLRMAKTIDSGGRVGGVGGAGFDLRSQKALENRGLIEYVGPQGKTRGRYEITEEGRKALLNG